MSLRSYAGQSRLLAKALIAPKTRPPSINYGLDPVAVMARRPTGGVVKLAYLAGEYPHALQGFSALYFGTAMLPPRYEDWIRVARSRSSPVFVNQNGVAFPAWHSEPELVNGPRRHAVERADCVVYQSEFCRRSADRFLAPARGRSVVIHNPVDTATFVPPVAEPDNRLLLMAGTQSAFKPVEGALLALRALHDRGRDDYTLLITGDLGRCLDEPRAEQRALEVVRRLDLQGSVEFLTRYQRAEAPALFQRAHVLLHPVATDACPNVVLEALASGLPVVHLSTGGTPELVGADAGICIEVSEDFDTWQVGRPEEMAEAVLGIEATRTTFSAAARRRAVDLFDLQLWLERHRRLFSALGIP